jgi:rod shape-determining protein MreD
MIWFLAVPLLAALSLIQSSILRQISFLDGSLDLLLLAVVCWSLLRPEEGLVWALLAGIFSDLFSGGPFGVTSIACLLVAFIVGQLHGRLWTDSPLAVMAITLLSTMLLHLAIIAQLLILGRTLNVGYALAYTTLPTAFLNTLFVIPAYLLLRRLHQATSPPAASAEEE